MLDVRLLMELQPYAMTAKVAHDGHVILVGMSLDGITYISDIDVGLTAHLFAYFQTLPCHIHETLPARFRLAHDKHTARIGIVTVENRGAIHIDDIALLQYLILRRDAVTDDVIDTGAAGIGKPFVVKRCRYAPVLRGIVIYDFVYLPRGHPRTNALRNGIEHCRIQDASLPNALYLLGSLDKIARGNKFPVRLCFQYATVHVGQWLPIRNRPNVLFFIFSHNRPLLPPLSSEAGNP